MLSYAYRFTYRNQCNTDFDLITSVAFDAGFDQIGTGTAMEAIEVDKYDGTKIDYFARYTDRIELQITMTKKDYTDFTRQEKRNILRWLSGHKQASWLELYDEDESKIIDFFGRFTSVDEKIADSRTIGFVAIFQSPYPYGFSPIREIKQKFIGASTIIVQNDSDVEDYVYPYFTITPNKDIDLLSIKNKTTNVTTFIKNLKANETLTLDNEHKLAFTNNEYRMMGEDFYGDVDGYITNYPVFIALEPTDNNIFIDTNDDACECSYSLTYRYPITLGTVV